MREYLWEIGRTTTSGSGEPTESGVPLPETEPEARGDFPLGVAARRQRAGRSWSARAGAKRPLSQFEPFSLTYGLWR